MGRSFPGGTIVHVRCVVSSSGGIAPARLLPNAVNENCSWQEAVVHEEQPPPRPIEVGDRVRARETYVKGTVMAKHDKSLWVLCDTRVEPLTWSVSQVERID